MGIAELTTVTVLVADSTKLAGRPAPYLIVELEELESGLKSSVIGHIHMLLYVHG
jgi:hypothetical protein